MLTQSQTLNWQSLLGGEKEQPYFQKIMATLQQLRSQDKVIYPLQKDIFNALRLTPFDEVKVVIIGQDPYHGPRQAHGLSFSVLRGVPTPPSLQNIFLELKNDLNIPMPKHGCLEKWSKQGVLLLNATLTVEAGNPQSHAKLGWQIFTDKVISSLNNHEKSIVFLLWGSSAQQKSPLITNPNHFILSAPHPSPLSAHRGFLGCKHFSKTNELLRKAERGEIDWEIG